MAVRAEIPDGKGLKANSLGLISNVVIGVASTAPAYSLAATVGLVAAAVGFQTPAIMILAFVPMLLVSIAYYYLNRTDPDCGTCFWWVTRAMGPHTGWMTGWAIIVADVIVMAALAQIAGQYTFLLVGADSLADSTAWVTVVGVVWIAAMTAISVLGIEISARTQILLLGAELLALGVFAVTALAKVYGSAPEGSVRPSLSWLNPFAISSTSALTAGLLLGVFIYWGWDSTVVVNEETRNKARTPGRGAVLSTFLLVSTFVVVAVAAQAFGGTDPLVEGSDDIFAVLGEAVLGSRLDKLLILAVLSSAAAATLTTILPAARTSLSMSWHGAAPRRFGIVDPRWLTPVFATVTMGVVSVIWYVGLTLLSQNVLADSIAALGLMIAFYYGLVGFACPILFRRQVVSSAKNALLLGLLPTLGGLMLVAIFVRSAIDLAKPEMSGSGTSWFGVGPPVLIAAMFVLVGLILMLLQWRVDPRFFRRGPEVEGPQSESLPDSGPSLALDAQARNQHHRAEAARHRRDPGA
ncbi:MAG: APC family permease [Acidimicrobiales bacterium]